MKSYRYVLCFLTVTLISCLSPLLAQEYSSINGKLTGQATGEAIPFANIVLYSRQDSKLYDVSTSDTTGFFSFSRIPGGNYRLEIHMIGYEKYTREIDLQSNLKYNAGTIFLHEDAISLGETVVSAERVKGRSEKDKTTFYITGKMAELSGNGLDIVKLIPGIQVDLRNNISLEGSGNILLLVDGKERDKNFVSQISPDMIDKVEIMSTPPAKYDATVTGVVNVVMKKEKKSGFNGQMNLEIPASGSIYSHPDYNLSFGYNKLTFFTSYNGEIIRFDQIESINRNISSDEGSFETSSSQLLEQRLWSNRFHYGLDYSFNKKWQAGFYGYYDIYSQKYDGIAEVTRDLKDTIPWRTMRASSYLNRSNFNSSFIKYKFGEKGSTLDLDFSNYHFSGNNTDAYIPSASGNGSEYLKNESRPFLNASTFKTDCNIVLGQNSTLSAGIRLRSQKMEDVKAAGFDFSEKTYAAYSSIGVTRPRYEWTFGLRAEKSTSALKNSFDKSYLSLLPSATLNLKLKQDRSLKIAASRNISRPNLYQLNPNLSFDDPHTVHSGNPGLDPEIRTSSFIEYSRKAGSNYFSARLFYNQSSGVISNLTRINDTSVFETRIYNLGTIRQSGLQLSGTFKAGQRFNFIPYLRIYDNYCDVNSLASRYSVSDKDQIVFEPGLSAIAAFNHNINLSVNFQYNSPKNSIQWNSFGDALYFISVEKTFKNALKASIVSGLPLTRRFTYQGSEVSGRGFSSRYAGEVLVRNFLVSCKLSYQFTYGKKNEKVNRSGADVELPKKGL